ncbi:extracellular solute-binding protein [Microbacterium sp. GXF0217]
MVEMTRRQFFGAAAALSAAGMLSACSSPFDDTTASGGRTLEFVTFYTGPDGAIMQGIIDKYNAQSSEAQIRMSAPAYGGDYLTKLVTASIAGNPPAIMALHSYEVPPLRRFLHTMDLDRMGLSRNDFLPGTLELGAHEGKQLGVTMSTGPQAMVYNRRMFERAGLNPDRPPTDAASFVAAGKAIKETGPWGFIREPASWSPWLSMNWQNGGELVDGDRALFNSKEMIEAVEMERRWIHEDKISPTQLLDGVQMGQQLYDEKVGMIFIGPWGLQSVIDVNAQQGLDLAVAPMPAFFDAAPAVAATSHVYCIPKQARNDDWIRTESEKFISWLIREGSSTWGRAQAPAYIGAKEDMLASEDPVVTAMQTFVDESPRARFVPYAPRWNLAFSYATNATQSAIYRNQDPTALLNAAAKQATAAIQGARR